MSKSVRVKVEFEMQVVLGDGFNEALEQAKKDDNLNGLGKYWLTIPEGTRHLVIAEGLSIAAIKECVLEYNRHQSYGLVAFSKLGNLRAQVISEKK